MPRSPAISPYRTSLSPLRARARHRSQRLLQYLSLSADKEITMRPQLAAMDPQTCFALIVGQVATLYEASLARTQTPDVAVSEVTPLQAPTSFDPTAWSTRRKWIYTFLVSLTMFNASFASTAPNGAGTHMVQQYGLSNEEMVFIATSFVGGCVAGPIVWAPLSEVYGRRLVFLTSTLFYIITNIGCALAPSKAVLFSCRFLAGAFASSAFSNAAAVITDLYPPADRAKPMIVASLAPLLGPCFGPLFGAGISLHLRWPFVFWLLGAIGLLLEAALFCVPETYVPVISARHEQKQSIRSQGSWKHRARIFLIVNLGRPVSIEVVPIRAETDRVDSATDTHVLRKLAQHDVSRATRYVRHVLPFLLLRAYVS